MKLYNEPKIEVHLFDCDIKTLDMGGTGSFESTQINLPEFARSGVIADIND